MPSLGRSQPAGDVQRQPRSLLEFGRRRYPGNKRGGALKRSLKAEQQRARAADRGPPTSNRSRAPRSAGSATAHIARAPEQHRRSTTVAILCPPTALLDSGRWEMLRLTSGGLPCRWGRQL